MYNKNDKKSFKFTYEGRSETTKRAPRERIVGPGFQVKVIDNDVNKAWRKLKKMTMDDGMLEDIRERQHFVKPSNKRHKASRTEVRRRKKLRIKAMILSSEFPNYSNKKLGKLSAKKGKNGLRSLGLNMRLSTKKKEFKRK